MYNYPHRNDLCCCNEIICAALVPPVPRLQPWSRPVLAGHGTTTPNRLETVGLFSFSPFSHALNCLKVRHPPLKPRKTLKAQRTAQTQTDAAPRLKNRFKAATRPFNAKWQSLSSLKNSTGSLKTQVLVFTKSNTLDIDYSLRHAYSISYAIVLPMP